MVTYPPEMLPSADDPGGADVIVCARDGCPKDAEIDRLRATLQFYADIETYRGHGMQDAEIIHDGGQNARRALEGK